MHSLEPESWSEMWGVPESATKCLYLGAVAIRVTVLKSHRPQRAWGAPPGSTNVKCTSFSHSEGGGGGGASSCQPGWTQLSTVTDI